MVPGLIGRKIGMTQLYQPDGTVRPVTVLEAGPCFITQVKTAQTDGYDAVQVGFGEVKRLNKPRQGHLKGIGNLRYLREFRTPEAAGLEVGNRINVDIFEPGALIDVTGTSKGRGFAGGVRRHHFHGGPKTHGQSDRHRAPGSIGSGTTPGRVWKGTRMAGHMGAEQVTVRHLKVLRVDPERNVLIVEGAVPGAAKGLVLIRRSPAKKPRKKD